jgi:hypothetical protein
LLSFCHCIVSPSIYSFWLPLCYLLVIVLSLLPFTASDYPFVIFWPLYCLSFHLQLLITPLISFGHCIVSPSIYSFWLPLCYLLVIVLSLLPFIASHYPFVIFWPLYCLSFHLQLLITPLISLNFSYTMPFNIRINYGWIKQIYGILMPSLYVAFQWSNNLNK